MRDLLRLLTLPLVLIARVAVGAGKSLAVCTGSAWVDSRGGFHWRGE